MTRCKGKTCKGTVCKKDARTGRMYCKIHNTYTNMESPEYIPLPEPKSYTQENIKKIQKMQTLYKKQKQRKNAVKTIEKFRHRKQQRTLFQNLQNARKTYREKHNNISVQQPNLRCTSHLNKPKLPEIKTEKTNFKPINLVATFFDRNGKIMKTPISRQNLSYYTKNSLHPVNWQKFGNRPTRPKIQSYQDHMFYYAKQQLKNKRKEPLTSDLVTSIYNNYSARTLVENMFREKNSTEYSKSEIKQALTKLSKELKIGEETNMYFKYPNVSKSQYKLNGINKKKIFKIKEYLKQIHPITRKEIIVTRLKLKKVIVRGYYNYFTHLQRPDTSKIKYTIYYGRGERGHFEYSGRQVFY